MRSTQPPTEIQVSWAQRHQPHFIGGTGHVGSEVVKELKKRDADVRVLVRKADEKSLPGVEMVVGDLLVDKCIFSTLSLQMS